MNVAFGNKEGAEGAAAHTDVAASVTPAPAPAAQSQALVPAPAKAVAPATSGMLVADYLPRMKDVILPRINIVQNIGKLLETYEAGEVVYDNRHVLFSPRRVKGEKVEEGTPGLTIVCLGFNPTRWVEKTSGGVRGIIVNNEDDIPRHGGTTDYGEWKMKAGSGMKYFQPLAEALFAIERPAHIKDDDTVFTFATGEGAAVRKFTLAIFAMKSTAYTAAAKRVFFTQRSVGYLKAGGYPSWEFTLTTKEESYDGGNKAWVPVVAPKQKTEPAVLAWVREVLGAPAQEQPTGGAEA